MKAERIQTNPSFQSKCLRRHSHSHLFKKQHQVDPRTQTNLVPDVSYLKNPPSGYLEPAVDVWGSLNVILTNIGSGTYANEYEFQADLFRTFNLAKDGHFRFFPDLLTKALEFGRTVGLVSVSLDGVEIPKVYTRGAPVNNLMTPNHQR